MNWLRRRHHARRRAEEALVLSYLQDGRSAFGLDIGRATRLRSGRLYPTLTRLLQTGQVEDGWEDAAVKLCPRRYYRSTTPITVGVPQPPTEDGQQ